MAENERATSICKSVFKNGENTITVQQFTHAWIELINTLEKSKAQVFMVE